MHILLAEDERPLAEGDSNRWKLKMPSLKTQVLAVMLPAMLAMGGLELWFMHEETVDLSLQAALRLVLIFAVIIVVIGLLFSYMLRPIDTLAQQIGSQGTEEIQPIELSALPQEIQPLAHAFNDRMRSIKRLMEQQRRFLDDASHQLRAPLATLHAQVGHAIRQGPGEELAHVLRSIELQLESSSRSVTQLLNLASAEAMTPACEEFDVGELLREIGRRLSPLAVEKTLDFGIDVSDDACMCSGDRHLLGEAMSNLAHNAIAYADHGGKVTLTAKVSSESVTFAAINTGSPIPSSVLREVGQRFVRGRQGNGVGLGLAIAKSIVERHGGHLTLRSEPTEEANTAQMWWPQAAQRQLSTTEEP